MKRQQHIFSCFLLLSFVLCGCYSPVRYSGDIEAPTSAMTYGDIALSGDVRNRWWEAFGDEGLNAFVEVVLRESPTLQIAYLKLLDSEMAMRQAKSGYYPSISFSRGIGGGGEVYTDPSATPNFSLGLSMSYEIDIWGKVRAQTRVAELSRESAQDDAESAAITLVANVATQWFTIQYYNDRKELTQKLLALSEDYYELVESYYVAGQTTGMDVLEQRQQIETLRSTLNEIDANIRIAKHALSIMAGGQHVPQVAGKLPEAIDVGGTPTPRKESVASARMAKPRFSVAMTSTGPSTLGSTWVSMMRALESPMTRAASTYSLLRSTRVEPRTVRANCGQLLMPMANTTT